MTGWRKKQAQANDGRLRALRFFFCAVLAICIGRLSLLQVVNAAFYQALSSDRHGFYEELVAERGDVIVRDWKDGTEYMAATNEQRGTVYADTRDIKDPKAIADALANIFGWEIPEPVVEEETDGELATTLDEVAVPVDAGAESVTRPQEEPLPYDVLMTRLSKENDPYEPVERDVDQDILDRIRALKLEGIHDNLEAFRAYPEKNLGSHLTGFMGLDKEGKRTGRYGIEGHFNDFLAGKNGFLNTNADVEGNWIGLSSGSFEHAADGGDVVLTIDRTIQYEACKRLHEGVVETGAAGGAVVIMEPSTGKIIAICSDPDFDAAAYREVEDISAYNNQAIFTAYEPGSVIKPLVMSKGLDMGVVTPTTWFEDTGSVQVDDWVIKNAQEKIYGSVDMTNVLEDSINTGMVFVERKIGKDAVRDVLRDYGFGTLTGIELDTESAGTTASLDEISEIYYANASFGQGFTSTPLQLTAAYGAIANGGMLMKPYIVDELRYPDGTVEERTPKPIRQVIAKKTATTLGAMMVSTLENGHGTKGRVEGYYIAGKTGTAQVANANGRGYYANVTRATFAGFGPVENPRFAMVVYIDHPTKSEWADATAAPVFGQIAAFVLNYFEVPPTRK